MFKHLLVPLDFRDLEEGLIDAVRRLAVESAARITLLHVIEEIADLGDDSEMQSFYGRLERRAHEKLRPVSSRLEEAGIDCGLVVVLGRRSEEIVRYAAENEIDLIALRSRTLQESPARTWPTVSIQVAMISPVPVLLLR
jgi:nucleotide-binding universal stress UspA family protein